MPSLPGSLLSRPQEKHFCPDGANGKIQNFCQALAAAGRRAAAGQIPGPLSDWPGHLNPPRAPYSLLARAAPHSVRIVCRAHICSACMYILTGPGAPNWGSGMYPGKVCGPGEMRSREPRAFRPRLRSRGPRE